ncbi:uncharacterized protein [Fopius arisanus]|uniref:CID domain-containing protein n=1 Tax=Fopius arisanus TaxID=64838 RepID=A0A9R1TSJ1_9HYME|nr:PREDICTED: uncharacterized protein LOC105263189 [Fopius arisanus]
MVLVRDHEIVNEFRTCLEWLKDRHDTWAIGELTAMAIKLVNEYSAEMVVGLQQHIAQVPQELKLAGLYLLDSIIGNASHIYVDLFAEQLVNTFSSVFVFADSEMRALMFTLRKRWRKYFSAAVLHDLDCAIKSVDNNWPIFAHSSPSSNNSGSSSTSPTNTPAYRRSP